MTARTVVGLSLILAMVGLFAGCDLNRHTGHHGQLVFEFYSDKDTYNFNKPIIEGGYLDLFLYDVGEERPTEVQTAVSLDPDIARIEGHVANLVVVQGLAPGRARIEVRAVDEDGLVRPDTIAVRVDKPQTVRFDESHAHVVNGASTSIGVHGPYDPDEDDEADEDEAEATVVFQTGARVEIPWTRTSANGEPLVGYGVFPVAVAPAGAAKIHDRLTEDDSITLFMPDEPQTFELGPAIGYRGDRLLIEVVEPDSVDEAVDGAEKLGHALLFEVGLAEFGVGAEPRPHHLLEGHLKAARPGFSRREAASFGDEILEMAGRLPWWIMPLWMLLTPLICGPIWIVSKRRRPPY
jgi:hypothetical protein